MRDEFLNQLRKALENDLSGQAVQENMEYYKTYIDEEIRNGRTESEVISELGDPWIIARNIIGSPNTNQGYRTSEDSYVREERENRNQKSRVHVFEFDTWWKKILAILVVVFIVGGLISIISGVLSFVMPILMPILFVVLVIKIFSNRKR